MLQTGGHDKCAMECSQFNVHDATVNTLTGPVRSGLFSDAVRLRNSDDGQSDSHFVGSLDFLADGMTRGCTNHGDTAISSVRLLYPPCFLK